MKYASQYPEGTLTTLFKLIEEGHTQANDQISSSNTEASDFEYVYERICLVLTGADGDEPIRKFLLISKNFEVACLLNKRPRFYVSIFRCLIDAIRTVEMVPSFSDGRAWIEVFSIISNYLALPDKDIFGHIVFSRSQNVAAALLRLQEQGFGYVLEANQVAISEDSLIAICLRIETLVKQIGGTHVAHAIFAVLGAGSQTYRGYFLFGQATSMHPRAQDAKVPWNFLYSLALKHLHSSSEALRSDEDWQELLGLCRDLGAALDVEEYSTFAQISGLTAFGIPQAFKERVIFNELFSIPQWSFESAGELTENLIDALSSEGFQPPGFQWSLWRELLLTVVGLTHPTRFTFVAPWQFVSTVMPLAIAKKMLLKLSIGYLDVNKIYKNPFDTKERNSALFPLIRMDSEVYIMPPTGLTARALYERMLTILRDNTDRLFDKKLGNFVEKITKNALAQAGYVVEASGKFYTQPSTRVRYDMDVVAEGVDCIYLVECKSKVLKNSSRSGDLRDIIQDFTKSFLEMFLQVLRHETLLLENGEIIYEDGTSLELKGRRIERIMVSTLDHGSLQDRGFLRSVFLALLGGSLSSEDKKLNDSLEYLHEIHTKIVKQLSRLSLARKQTQDELLKSLFFNTWWLSIDQLQSLLSDSASFESSLQRTRGTVWGTGDVMTEFAQASKLHSRLIDR